MWVVRPSVVVHRSRPSVLASVVVMVTGSASPPAGQVLVVVMVVGLPPRAPKPRPMRVMRSVPP